MKKTISVNLANRNFYIEEDAFKVLDQYVSGIREYYKADDPEGEIVEDFEMRMGEIFQERAEKGQEVISIEMVMEVIKQMGRIEDLDEPNAASEEGKETNRKEEPRSNWQETTDRFSEKLEKKIYRDPKHKWLGGVIAGLAVHFGTEVALLRVIAVLLLITPATWIMVIIYVLAWIFLPEAESVSDRLRMEGKPLNSENLLYTISREHPEVNHKEEGSEENKPKKNNAIWWVVAALLIVGIVVMIIWGIGFLSNGYDPTLSLWDIGHGLTNIRETPIVVLLLIALLVLLFALGMLLLIYIVPIWLILRSHSLGALAKVVLVLIWLTITGGWILLTL